jgi:hypothetical protein
VLVVERHHPVVEDLGRGDLGLAVIELDEGDLGIGVDDGLLIDPLDPLQGADIEGVLSAAVARAFALELAVRFLVRLGLFERKLAKGRAKYIAARRRIRSQPMT